MANILVVDDEADLRALMRLALEREGHAVVETENALDAVDAVGRQPIDLVLLDVELPDRSGLEVLADITARSDVAVIFVSSRAEETDRVLGLRMGADDYIGKPFSVHELTARVAANLRRSKRNTAISDLVFGALVIRPLQRELAVDGRPVAVTAKEFDLLLHMARNPLRVFGRDELLRDVWRSKSDWQDPATVTEHIRRLRKKLQGDCAEARWLDTVRGAGYRFLP